MSEAEGEEEITTDTEARAEEEGKEEDVEEGAEVEGEKTMLHIKHAESTRSTVSTVHRAASTEEEVKSDTQKTDQLKPKNDRHELNIN